MKLVSFQLIFQTRQFPKVTPAPVSLGFLLNVWSLSALSGLFL